MMTRAAGTPAVTYGVETCGISDTHLDDARSVEARASAAEGGGKDPNLVLLFLDGPSGTLDPAFDAHVLPITRWAQAWFEGWQSRVHLTSAFENSGQKVRKATRTMWDVVAGPTAALLATMHRIKWAYNGPYIFADDQGRIFNLTLDPPPLR